MTIRVLIVDDSPTMRKALTVMLSSEEDIEVVAAAKDAAEARMLIKQLDPDVVTLDIVMPGMDGLSFLEKIMKLRPTPVVIVSGTTSEGAQATTQALQLGAVDCYSKEAIGRTKPCYDGGELAQLVREAASVRFVRRSANHAPPAHHAPIAPRHAHTRPDLIAIGSSTGGIEALHKLLSGFPADCPPTLIVQHVNESFAPAIVQSLDRATRPRVMLAESDIPLQPGNILFAPGGEKHLAVAKAGNRGYRSVLRSGGLVSGHRPSVDWLFSSVATVFGANSLGILLTGMGADGAQAMREMKDAGARTIAQDEASCVVFGMPRAAISLGAVSETLSLDTIAGAIFAGARTPEGACR